jgi:hypothetical protein
MSVGGASKMISRYKIVRPSARLVSEAVQSIVVDYAHGRIADEPDFTSRMLQAIQERLNGKTIKGILWQAVVTTSHGPNTQERATGADFMGVLNINLPDYTVRKGFLAQAKRADVLSDPNISRLKEQCERMLTLTPASYVFLYKRDSVRILPAISVLSADVTELTDLYNWSVQIFFESHLESFIGDRRLSVASGDQLEGFVRDHGVAHSLHLTAKQGDMLLK